MTAFHQTHVLRNPLRCVCTVQDGRVLVWDLRQSRPASMIGE